MSITYLRTSAQVPSPLGPSSFAIGAGASGAFSTGMTTGVSQNLNQQAAAIKLLSQVGGGGYGVVSGLDLSAGTGLNVILSAGIAKLDGVLEIVAASPFGSLQCRRRCRSRCRITPRPLFGSPPAVAWFHRPPWALRPWPSSF